MEYVKETMRGKKDNLNENAQLQFGGCVNTEYFTIITGSCLHQKIILALGVIANFNQLQKVCTKVLLQIQQNYRL